MGVKATDIWKLKTYVAESISGATNKDVRSNTLTYNSLKEVDTNVYELEGEYSYYDYSTSKDQSGSYKATVTLNGEITLLIIDDRVII
ncbi:MAG: hypothetical protein QXU18_00255 [Thermoplasmatales archaeon]